MRLPRPSRNGSPPDLGDFVLILLAGSLAGLRDRLLYDGFESASDLVADLVDVTDDYITRLDP